MTKEVKCTTQAEVDACVKSGNIALVFSGYFEISGSARVTACDSSSVRAYDSSSVRAYGSSSVRACDSSSVTACGSSSVRATGNVFIRLLSALKIKASFSVVVMAHTSEKVVEGGQVVWAATPKTLEEWCDFHGIEVNDDVAMLYKALNDDFTSPHKTSYAPGSIPVATDWDGGEEECGGGLHFSPSPAQALAFHSGAKRFAACYVKLSDMRAPTEGDTYPEKCKAKGCCAPCVEVDIHGKVIEQKQAA